MYYLYTVLGQIQSSSCSYYQAAIELCKDKKMVISFKQSIAYIYNELGMYDQALRVYEELEIGYEFAIKIASLKYTMGYVNGYKEVI